MRWQSTIRRVIHTIEVTIAIVLAIFPKVVNRNCSAPTVCLGKVSRVIVAIATVVLLSQSRWFTTAPRGVGLGMVGTSYDQIWAYDKSMWVYHHIPRLTCRSCSSLAHVGGKGSSSAAKLARHKPYGLPATSISDDW